VSSVVPAPGAPRRERAQQNKGFAQSVAFSAARGALLIGVAVIIGIALLQVIDDNGSSNLGEDGGNGAPTNTSAAGSSSTTTTTGDDEPAVRPPAEISVQVLNGSGVQGAAAALTAQLQGGGYPTIEPTDTDDAQGTTVYCAGGLDAEAAALAAAVASEPPATVEAMPDPRPDNADPVVTCLVVLGA
jgi:hypothetical protein